MANPMYVYIQPSEDIWRPGSLLVPRDFPHLERHLGRFAHYMADRMAEEVVNAINDQRYRDRWVPLSVPYLDYKRRKGLSLRIWEATGTLKNSIRAYRSGSTWVVGVSQRLYYPGTDIKIYRIARYMEYGTDKMPARPLFYRVARRMSRDISLHWARYRKEVGV